MIKKVLIGVVALVAILFLGGMFYGGSIVKGSVEKYGPEYTGTSVVLDDVSFSPIGGSAGLSGLVIGSPEGFDAEKTFSLKDISVKLKPSTLLSDTVHINEIRITDPEITVEYKKGKLNIGALMDNLSQYAKEGTEETTTTVIIDDLYITGAKVYVMGLPVGEEGAPIILPDIHLQDIGNVSGNEEGVSFVEASEETMAAVTSAVTKVLASSKIEELMEGGKKFLKGIFGGGDDDEEDDGGGN
ncbi:MAG: hypothetical protein V3R64_07775 [Sphingomonadales bacterium]